MPELLWSIQCIRPNFGGRLDLKLAFEQDLDGRGIFSQWRGRHEIDLAFGEVELQKVGLFDVIRSQRFCFVVTRSKARLVCLLQRPAGLCELRRAPGI